jgi:hypothetical protein
MSDRWHGLFSLLTDAVDMKLSGEEVKYIDEPYQPPSQPIFLHPLRRMRVRFQLVLLILPSVICFNPRSAALHRCQFKYSLRPHIGPSLQMLSYENSEYYWYL